MERNQLLIKQLTILSMPEKSAKTVTFHPQRNLITGENDVGKSTIIKSIYHSLGADVHFDNVWEKTDAISLLTFSYGGSDYKILRSRGHFGLFDERGTLLQSFDSVIKGLSPYLSKLFNSKLKLKQSKTNQRIPASPAIQFLPFYIDQDKSWSKPWNSFEGLGVFTSFKRDLINFITGIRPNEYFLLSERIDQLSASLTTLRDESGVLSSAKKAVEKYIPKATFDIDIKAFKRDVDKLIVKLEGLKNKENDYRKNLIKLKNKEAFIDNEIMLVSKSIREIDKDYEHSLNDLDGEITCPTCNATYENSMVSRFGLLEDIDTCRSLLADYLEDKKKVVKEVVKLESHLTLQGAKVREINNLLNEKKGKVRLKDLIRNESSKQVKEIFSRSQSGYISQIAEIEGEKSGLEDDRSKLNNKDRKELIINKFNTFIDLFLLKLNVHTLNSDGFSDIPLSVRSQGSDTPRALLAYYYAILFTSREFTSLPLFPLVVDSPNQQDQDAQNRYKIIKFIFENTPNDYQLILGTVDLHGVEYDGLTISPSTKLKLLDRDEFDTAYNEVIPLLDRLQASLISNSCS
ncbi:AAA family ATPase [Microbulbifer celer]|uniref:AAA family ATPase n=1 Tax=Microbulbifer celer TaxID=435905 RepID=A0ABW3UE50_9GAMM|nr:AAA family ATPase [Microbulbifer celer]UFN58920.1 hypothetical protein LPW13_07740 [Microbulbifer celer]